MSAMNSERERVLKLVDVLKKEGKLYDNVYEVVKENIAKHPLVYDDDGLCYLNILDIEESVACRKYYDARINEWNVLFSGFYETEDCCEDENEADEWICGMIAGYITELIRGVLVMFG